jgi:hypothetical protein
MTYHPHFVQSSSAWFHRDAWLDLNTIQTFKHRARIVEMLRRDGQLAGPAKPTILGGPAYEGYSPHSQVRTYSFQVRRQAYKSFWNGAAGFTYGCSMSAAGGAGPLYGFGPDWQRLLDQEGGQQVATTLRAFLEAHDWWTFAPCPEAVVDGGEHEYAQSAVISGDGSELLVYYPDRTPATVRLDWGEQEAAELRIQATWYDPAHGTIEEAGVYSAYSTQGCLDGLCESFVPPQGWLDAVLILRRDE